MSFMILTGTSSKTNYMKKNFHPRHFLSFLFVKYMSELNE